MKRFVLDTTPAMAGDIVDVPEDMTCCVVRITGAYAKWLLRMMGEVRRIGKKAPVRELVLADGGAEWFASIPTPTGRTWRGEAANTTCDEVIVRMNTVCWSAFPKHGSYTVMSDEIGVAELKKIARKP